MVTRTTDNPEVPRTAPRGQEYHDIRPVSQDWRTELDRALHALWRLGRNIVLCWAPRRRGIEVLVVPFHIVPDFATTEKQVEKKGRGRRPVKIVERPIGLIEELITGSKRVTLKRCREVGKKFGFDSIYIDLPFVCGRDLTSLMIDSLVHRYGISYVEDRAVALFDIVNFTLFSPLEQVTQLNSLSYSVNSAHSKMLSRQMDVSFARTTTGDGFYVWNRDRSVQANVNLYHFMHLVMADNAIARAKATNNSTPLLRTCFHVGGHYEFYQSEALSPTIYSYIVGDVTIELARMIEQARPGQVIVGEFQVPMPDMDTGVVSKIDSIKFIEKTQKTLSSLKGLILSGDEIESIKCYLTGEKQANGKFNIKRYRIADKHGRTRDVFNAKINIYRIKAEPIFLGTQDTELAEFQAVERRIPRAAKRGRTDKPKRPRRRPSRGSRSAST